MSTLSRREGWTRVISKLPDQITLISGGKQQFCIPTVNVCTTTLMNCKSQEAPEAVFLSRFFFILLVPISSHCMSGNTDCLLCLVFVCVWLQTSGKRKWNKGINSSSFTNTYLNIYIFCSISMFTWSNHHPHPKHEPLKVTAYLYENGLRTDLLGCWNLLPNGSFSLWSARPSKAPSSFENTILATAQRDLSSTYLKWVMSAEEHPM